MAMYKFDQGKINDISYVDNNLVLTVQGDYLRIRLQGEPTPFIECKLEELIDHTGNVFDSMATFITYWNTYYAVGATFIGTIGNVGLLDDGGNLINPATEDTLQDILSATPKDTIDRHVLTSLVDTTNVAAATTYYSATTGVSMDGYSSLSLFGKLITTGTITMSIEATNDEDSDAADWVQIYGYDLKNNDFFNSWTVTNGTLTFAILFNGLNCRLFRVKIVDSASTNTYIVKARQAF